MTLQGYCHRCGLDHFLEEAEVSFPLKSASRSTSQPSGAASRAEQLRAPTQPGYLCVQEGLDREGKSSLLYCPSKHPPRSFSQHCQTLKTSVGKCGICFVFPWKGIHLSPAQPSVTLLPSSLPHPHTKTLLNCITVRLTSHPY